MKFTYLTLALSGLLAITMNSSSVEAQGFLGREQRISNKTENKNGTKIEEDDDIYCNGTLPGYNSSNGTFVNCTNIDGTLMNYTKFEDKTKVLKNKTKKNETKNPQ